MNDFIVLLEGNKEVYSEQVKEKGEELRNSKTERERERARPWRDNEESRSTDVSAKLC